MPMFPATVTVMRPVVCFLPLLQRVLERRLPLRRAALAGLLGWAAAGVAVPALAQQQSPASAPSASALKAMTVRGLADAPARITLSDGVWTGAPYEPGGASRPQVRLLERPIAWGDLDRDGRPEAAVLLSQTAGGSGEFLHLAVVTARGATAQTVATRLVGDRVQVRGLRIADGRVWLDVVRAGAQDASCCPGEVTSLGWRLDRGRLVPLKESSTARRLGPDTLGAGTWVLRQWQTGEVAAAQPKLTVSHQDGRFSGQSACNRFTAAVAARGEVPGDLQVSAPAATRMACEGAAATIESRYLEQLSRVRRMRFEQGLLALDYEAPGEGLLRTMLFEAR